MAKIPVSTFLSNVQKNANRVNQYDQGFDGSNGKCDCIGLINGAIRLSGQKWTGTHGSNYAARNETENLHEVTKTSQLSPGEVVYKYHKPGESGYALPAKYKNSSDQNDYYHVGVVTSVKPFRITHCTNVQGGIKVDNKLGQWRMAGKLKKVDYGEDKNMSELNANSYTAVVVADKGKTVNFRKTATKYGAVIKAIPVGTEVTVVEEVDDTWAKCEYEGKTGYMMLKFLEPAAVAMPEPGESDYRAVLEQIRNLVDSVLHNG